MSPDEKFVKALSTFERQVGEATQYWFAASTVNEVSKQDKDVFAAFQATPTFWLTVRGGLEQQAIVALGRIFGQRAANPVNIDSLRELVYDGRRTVFSKAAFAARGKEPHLVERFHEAAHDDFKRMSVFIKKYRKLYEQQFADIRNQYVAHTDDLSDAQLSAMFEKTRIRDFERMLEFLNRLHEALWDWYHNGRRPTFRVRRSSVRAMVSDRVERLGMRATPEHIVQQTRKVLAMVAAGYAADRKIAI